MRILRISGLVLLALAVVVGVRWAATAPDLPASGSESARRLAPGPFPVVQQERTLVDRSRPTAANGDHPGSSERTLVTTIWSPVGAEGPRPLAIYCHGFLSRGRGGAFLAEHLASHGWVVAAADFPLTHFFAPGGPRVEDAIHQPGDVSFLISSLLQGPDDETPSFGPIDPARIAVLGLSLGGLTTTLAAFHPALRDPRVRAAVSIAGTGGIFEPAFFRHADVPFLMIAGEADAIIGYAANAASIPDKIRDGGLVSLAGGTHAGFDDLAANALRLFANPDRPGCWALERNLDRSRAAGGVAMLGGPDIGIVPELARMGMPCEVPPPATGMNVGRQHAITKLAVRAFLESRFAASEAEREGHAHYLARGLAVDFPEVRFEPAREDRTAGR